MLLPLVALFLLGTAVAVGVFTTVFSIFSACCVVGLAPYRNAGNRIEILGIAAIVLAFATMYFGYQFTFAALVVYSVIGGIVWPVLRVSIHVTDLQTMESIGRPGADFFPTMIFRDISLWAWRSLGGLAFVALERFAPNQQAFLSTGLYFFALALLLVFVGAVVLVRAMRDPRTV